MSEIEGKAAREWSQREAVRHRRSRECGEHSGESNQAVSECGQPTSLNWATPKVFASKARGLQSAFQRFRFQRFSLSEWLGGLRSM
jgi:hypothetical protein